MQVQQEPSKSTQLSIIRQITLCSFNETGHRTQLFLPPLQFLFIFYCTNEEISSSINVWLLYSETYRSCVQMDAFDNIAFPHQSRVIVEENEGSCIHVWLITAMKVTFYESVNKSPDTAPYNFQTGSCKKYYFVFQQATVKLNQFINDALL